MLLKRKTVSLTNVVNLGISIFYISALVVIIPNSLAWNVASPHDRNRQCAQIFFQSSFKGPNFVLKDEEQISDLSEIQSYYKKASNKVKSSLNDDELDNQKHENSSIVYSFHIEEGCKLEVSPLAYLKGNVLEFLGDVEEIPEDWFVPKSVACECPKTCQCENIKIRRSECGRAFIKDECTNCKAAFSSLKPKHYSSSVGGGDGNLEWDEFPEKWANQVTTLVLRDGCNASLRFSKLNKDGIGDLTPAFGFTKTKVTQNISASGSLTHYICQCSAQQSSTVEISSGNSNQNYPPLVTIPRTKGAINLLLGSRQDLKNHPGLISALQSLRSRKSSKNAYIMLLGMSGSGKSSAVNLLFDHPNITKVGDYVSTTKDILQFSIPVPIPDLGMNNTYLHVIDTPGIGDTSGLSEDARFLASLDTFLITHSDLKRSLPNVILIFSKFSDNRFSGEGSSFVKMLRTINVFQDRLIDKRSTNVIFVLTHFLSETKEITRDPSKRISAIRSVIQEYTSLPRPIHIVLAENKPEESHLPNINGFYLLPNREFYPKNLFDQMQRNLVNGQDPVGEAVIRTAFSNSDNFKIHKKSYPLLPSTDENVTKYLGILGALNKAVNTTEVSTALQEAYQNVDSQLQAKYPHELNILQRNLYSKNIWMRDDIPRISIDILKLLEQIQINPVTLFLLESAFNLTIPEFSTGFIVGSGYSLSKDRVLPGQIFDHGQSTVHTSDFIFKVPALYKITMDHNIDNQFQVSTNKDDFINKRMSSLGLPETSIVKSEYNSSVDQYPGFNLITLSDSKTSEYPWNSLTATVNYHAFHIGLNENVKLSNDLSEYLNNLKPLNISDEINVKIWKDFFVKYGTHVVTSAFGGGSIKITAVCTKPLKNGDKFTILSETLANVTEQLGNELIGKDGVYNAPDDIFYSFSQSGGSPKHFWSNFSELDEVKNVDEWVNSLKYEPTVLTNRLQVEPISKIVKDFGSDEEKLKGELIEEAAFSLLNSSLVFIPVEGVMDNNPNVRERTRKEQSDFEKMQQFSIMFKTISETNQEAQANLMKMMIESQRKRQVEEERWQERVRLMEEQRKIQDRNLLEQQRHDEQIQLKREQLEMDRLAQDNLLREEKEQATRQSEIEQLRMLEEIRARNEMNLFNFITQENARRDEMILRGQKKWHHRLGDFLQGGLIGLALGG